MTQDTHGENKPERPGAGPQRLSRRGVLRAGAALGVAFAGVVGAAPAVAGPGTEHGEGAGEPDPGHLPGWDMQDKDDPRKNTHLWIVVQSLEMLRPLTGPEGAAARLLLQLTTDQQEQLHQGIWDADYESPWNGPYGLYAYHFYNPATGSNFLSCTFWPDSCHQTARVWGKTCFDRSLAAYQVRDYATAVYYLGLSLHYLTDLSQPMHAANFRAGDMRAPTYHSYFESYAIKWTNNTNPPPIPYEQTIESDAFEGYIDVAARNALERSKFLLSKDAIDAFYRYGTKNEWAEPYGNPVIQASLEDARRVTSQYLLMWIQQALSLHPPHTWSIEDLTKSSGGQVAMAQTLGALAHDNAQKPAWAQERVFSIDGDRHVQVMSRQQDGSWQNLDLTVHTGAPAPGKTTNLAATTAPGVDASWMGALAVFIGSDRHVHGLLAPAGGDWMHGDLTAITSAPPARGDLLWAYCTTNICSEQVVFVDDNAHVRSITRVKGGTWSVLDLTAMTGAPPMDGAALSGSSSDYASQQTVVYLDKAGHVHEIGGVMTVDGLWATPWHADLTEITKAPLAEKPLIAGSTWYAGSTKQVAYVGADGHIYELSVPFGGVKPWVCTDLTAVADAPVVDVMALIAFEWQATSEKHTVVLDRDGHVHDLSLGPTGAWQYADLTQTLEAPLAAETALAGYARYLHARLGITYVDRERGHVWSLASTPGATSRAPA